MASGFCGLGASPMPTHALSPLLLRAATDGQGVEATGVQPIASPSLSEREGTVGDGLEFKEDERI